MTDKTPTFIPPEDIYGQAFESAVHAYERTKNIQASSEATADTILERYGFPTIFGILAHKMPSNWWRLKLTENVTIERLLTNVLAAIVAHELAEAAGLDVGPTEAGNSLQAPTQGVQDSEKGKVGKAIRLTRPKPVR